MANFLFSQQDGKSMLETSRKLTPRFDKNGLLTAIVTDFDSGELLMVAHMNDEALSKTIQTNQSFFWSRSRQALWRKGKTSGATQRVREIRIDCDQDAVWLKVSVAQDTGTCHTGASSCFYRRIEMYDNEITLASDKDRKSLTSDPETSHD